MAEHTYKGIPHIYSTKTHNRANIKGNERVKHTHTHPYRREGANKRFGSGGLWEMFH